MLPFSVLIQLPADAWGHTLIAYPRLVMVCSLGMYAEHLLALLSW
jgi:hypothetical protein